MRNFSELNEREVLALAISLEEEDERTYDNYAHYLEPNYPATAAVFAAMSEEESGHRQRLIELYRQKFGDFIPLIRRTDVRGFMKRQSVWLFRPFALDKIRQQVEGMEMESRRFYRNAARHSKDASLRQLFDDLAAEERRHESKAESLLDEHVAPKEREAEDETQRRLFVLQIVQPGLAGLMDGSVSTLAPIFAAAFATRQSHDAFVVGLAASIGAGISMAFAEAASDDGSLTGRGSPVLRGIVTGAMTTLGGLGHTMPFIIPEFRTALLIAVLVVAVELAAISWIRNRYMDTPLLRAAFQVVVGGVLVFLTGIIIGGAG
ncbi:MAG TPA: ferritin family protein [Candidatus Binatia bacterium]|nr:ferritin family protein [Candidatus Binatia bacterium]